jgi:hypothetical protein
MNSKLAVITAILFDTEYRAVPLDYDYKQD